MKYSSFDPSGSIKDVNQCLLGLVAKVGQFLASLLYPENADNSQTQNDIEVSANNIHSIVADSLFVAFITSE